MEPMVGLEIDKSLRHTIVFDSQCAVYVFQAFLSQSVITEICSLLIHHDHPVVSENTLGVACLNCHRKGMT